MVVIIVLPQIIFWAGVIRMYANSNAINATYTATGILRYLTISKLDSEIISLNYTDF
jgi:hypothetical protein